MQLLDLTKLTAEERAAWRKWNRERWEAVEAFKAQELAAMTDEQVREAIDVLALPDDFWSERADWSGLVEQQALFSRLVR